MNRNATVRHWKKILALVIVAIATLLVAAFVLGSFLIVERPIEDPDVIYVLAGSADYRERNIEAARSFRMRDQAKVILTDDRLQGGWNNKLERNPFFVERARWLLNENGVSDNSIEVLPDVINGTEDEADALLRYVCSNSSVNKVLLVTSAYHTRRTLLVFEDATVSCGRKISLGISHPKAGTELSDRIFWWVKPRSAKNVIGEYVKLAAYYF